MKNNFRRLLVVILVAVFFLSLYAITANTLHVDDPIKSITPLPLSTPKENVSKLDELDEFLSKVKIGPTQVVRKSSNISESFESYDDFKKVYGKSAGKGLEWHHIVGQTQIERSNFPSEWINCTDNIVAIDKKTHQAITSFYNSLVPGTKLRYYEWLVGQSYDVQYQAGLDIIERALAGSL